MILAWLLLLTGLTISAVAIYYSVVGLTAIFSAAVIPIIIMGSALEVGKLVCASWLKANWERAPRFMKYYMITAVMVLMLITSMGIFGFLSKAHNDQNLVSGDVQSKIAIYDEKIKTERENIEANRKALKQMDATIDETIARSKTDQGAVNANAMRQRQAKERTQIQADITKSQKSIATLNEERSPIAAEVRKVEAEVGPIKYIAKFIYGDHGTDENMLEKAVTWIIVLIVVVFDPLAVIMLLAAQMTFGWKKDEEQAEGDSLTTESDNNIVVEPTVTTPEDTPAYEPDNGPITNEQIEQIKATIEAPKEETSKTPLTALGGDITAPEEPLVTIPGTEESELEKWNKMIEQAEHELAQEAIKQEEAKRYHSEVAPANSYTEVTGDRLKPDLTEVIEPESEESKKKTYMIKDETGAIQVKARE
jgi:hypothetical protein